MISLGFRQLIACVLLSVFLAGCATFPHSRSEAGKKISGAKTESMLLEANRELDTVNEQSSAFYAQLGPVLQEIKQFTTRPGWAEFEQILLEYPPLRDPDSEDEITPEVESRFAEWSRTWNSSWEETFVAYRDLVDKCIIMEAKKLAVRERFLVVQAKYVAAVMLEVSAGHEKEGKEIYSVVEVLDKTAAELNSYQPNDLGLYKSE
jgi:hypothetical protein